MAIELTSLVAGVASWLRDQPVLILLFFTAPLVVLARWRQTFPSRLLVLLGLFPALTTLLIAWQPRFLPVVMVIDIAVILLATFDVARVGSVNRFAVERQCALIGSLNQAHAVRLVLSNLGPQPVAVLVRDDVPQEMNADPPQFELTISPFSQAILRYEARSRRRGAFQLECVYVRVRSRLGLWNYYLKLKCRTTVKVYPDLKQLSEYALLARTNRLNLMGLRRTRQIGQDNEFERLRDYTLDDNYKHIDWRSTARRNKLTVKDFQTNQSQRVIFMLDCGRMMTNQASGISLLDHALNATLMLAYIALERGDSVGLITFSNQVHSSVPLRGGRGQMNRLLHAVYDRFPQLVESRYEDAFLHLSSRYRKRSLVVLITNIIDEVNAQQIHRYLSLFSGRHLPLAVVLRDPRVFDVMDAPSQEDADLYRQAAAAQILTWRQQVLIDLQHRGVLIVDALPEQMTAPLINQYLEVKARHLL